MILEREKSIKYYGRLLTAGVDTALLNVEKPLSEDDKVATLHCDTALTIC